MYDSLQTELYDLTEEMKMVEAELAEARSLGDLSENEEYWVLKDRKMQLEDSIHILKSYLSNAKILTDQEAEELRMQLCEEYVRKEDEIYQRVKKISVQHIANALVHNSSMGCCGREDMGEFLVTPNELFKKGQFYIGSRFDFDNF